MLNYKCTVLGLLVLSLAAIAGGGGDDAQKELVWGNPIRGVALYGTVEKAAYELGKEVHVTLHLRNVGQEAVLVQQTAIEGDYELALFYADGRPVRRSELAQRKDNEPLQGLPNLPLPPVPPSRRHVRLDRGKEIEERLVANRWFKIEHEGEYFLVVMRRVSSWETGFAISNGVLFSVKKPEGETEEE